MSQSEEILKSFEEIRERRWTRMDEIVQGTDDIDEFLADIANLATVLYVLKKTTTRKTGFKPYGRTPGT